MVTKVCVLNIAMPHESSIGGPWIHETSHTFTLFVNIRYDLRRGVIDGGAGGKIISTNIF